MQTIYDTETLFKPTSAGVHVQRVQELNETTARVVLSFNGPLTQRNLDQSIAASFKGEDGASTVRAAPGSAMVIEQASGRNLVDVVLKQNRKALPYNDETIAANGMHVHTANVFLDNDDAIWQLQGEGDSRILVQTASEDIKSVLESRRNFLTAGIDTAAAGHDLSERTSFGDFVVLYDADSEQQVAGVVVAKNTVHAMDLDQIIAFKDEEVMVASAIDSEVVATLKPFNVEKADAQDFASMYLDYMRQWYKDYPDYVAQVKAAIDQFLAKRGVVAA